MKTKAKSHPPSASPQRAALILSLLCAVSVPAFAQDSSAAKSGADSGKGKEKEKKSTFNPNYPVPLSPVIPHDADTTGVTSLATARRAFDINSWQTFIALNWPTEKDGKPAPKISTPKLPPLWTTWKDSYAVFLPDGGKPGPWKSPRILPPAYASMANLMAAGPGNIRMLFKTQKIEPHTQKIPEVDQAFSGSLIDWRGNLVHYEILMNEPEFDFIVANELYNLDGQVVFSNSGKTLTFPSGNNAVKGEKGIGAIELKLAWKTLDPKKDITTRYLSMPAYVTKADGKFEKVDVGLVGMHIGHKTESSPQWIWSTFEQVDNLAVDELAPPEDGKTLVPTFYNPNEQATPVNVIRQDASKNQLPTQVQRVIPIEESTAALTRQVQELLRREKSPLQYYELVGTQWPTNPKAPPTPGGQGTAPGSVTNKPGGDPQPVYLTNMTMETYFQVGNQPAGNEEEGNVTDTTPIFGTESCMGCHSSAGIATGKDAKGNPIFSGQLTGDFSWLPEQKAHWKTVKK